MVFNIKKMKYIGIFSMMYTDNVRLNCTFLFFYSAYGGSVILLVPGGHVIRMRLIPTKGNRSFYKVQ